MLDPLRLLLLQQCMGNNVDPAATAQLLAQQDDPNLRFLADLMKRRVHNEAELSPPPNAAAALHPKAEHAVADVARRPVRINRALFAELRHLRARNAELADALGACSCWGEDPHCEDCHGEGVPGSREPDRQCFDSLVRPTLRRFRKGLQRPGQGEPRVADVSSGSSASPIESDMVKRSIT